MTTSPRRIVLLASDGFSVERVIAEPLAAGINEELRRLRQEHPGRSLAAEWLRGNKWIRWITSVETTHHEGQITAT